MDFLDVLQQADYLTSDGIGLYVGYQINDSRYVKTLQLFFIVYYIFNIIFRKSMLYKKYGERICGSDLTQGLVEYAQKNKIRIAILDPYFPQDDAKCAAQKHFRKNLEKKFPKLLFDYYILDVSEEQEMYSHIRESQAQILFATL
jgi:UDP-N-acetyl-D-mannosaminuronic acid transferase (WecB/TagA/CpsF family)